MPPIKGCVELDNEFNLDLLDQGDKLLVLVAPKEILVVTFGTIGEFPFNKLVEVVRGEFIMEGLDNNEELL